MRRKRLLALALACAVWISLLIVCSASWFIIRQEANPPDYSKPDTSPFFTQGGTYNGNQILPTLTADGSDVYGADFDYTATWVSGVYHDGTTAIAAGDSTSVGIAAGTHYYEIVDNRTGQVICQRHAVTIAQRPVTVAAVADQVTFVGATPKWKVEINGITPTGQATYIGEFTYTGATIALSDFGTNGKLTSTTAHSATANVPATKKELTQNVATYYSLTKSDGLYYNNYYVPSDLQFQAACYILPTTYTTESTASYYGTLTAAIKATTSGTIYPMQSLKYNNQTYNVTAGTAGSFSHTITESCTLASGVTLTVAHDMAAPDTTPVLVNPPTGTTYPCVYDTSTYASHFKNAVTIAAGVTLTNAGTINITGTVSGGGGGHSQNSVTAGAHSRIVMAGSTASPSKIVSTGTITCHGFIDEATKNNGSLVEIKSGTLTTVFTINEHRGGDIYMGMANPTTTNLMQAVTSSYTPELTCMPFNRMYIHSIIPTVKIYDAASVKGYADLYANSAHNETTIDLVSTATSSFLQISSGTEVVIKFDPVSMQHDLDVYGSAKLNNLTLTLKVSYSGLNGTLHFTSKGILYPISYHWNVNLKPFASGSAATVDLSSQDIKLLPGATLTVDPNVTVNVGTVAVYKDNALLRDLGYVAANNYPNNTPAELIVNGTLNVTNLGGTVKTQTVGSVIKISGSTSVVSKEIIDTYDTSLSVMGKTLEFKGSTYSDPSVCTLTANASVATSTTLATNRNLSVKTYRGFQLLNTTTRVLRPDTATLTLDPAGGNISSTTLEVTISDSGMTTAVADLPTPTLSVEGVDFLGWYLDSTLTTCLTDPAQIMSDAKLYAKWSAAMYTVTYVDNVKGQTFAPAMVIENTAAVLPTSDANDDYTVTYYLKGWSLTEGGEVIDSHTVTEDVTLYAVWGDKVSLTVKVQSGADGSLTQGTTPSYTVYISPDQTDASAKQISGLGGTNGATSTFHIIPGYYVKISATDTASGNSFSSYTAFNSTQTITLKGNDGSCIVEGTLITLADGTQKRVEDLTYEDQLLIFNHHTGKMEAGYIAMLDHLEVQRDWFDIVNLVFSNGEILRIVWNHGVFDVTLNEYVFINETNMTDYVGHEFYSSYYNGSEFVSELVTLTDAYVTTEYVRIYNPTTVWHMNYFASGILNVTAAPQVVSGHMNYFELDADMKYDEEQMQADIERYGLYTYEDFKDYLTEEQFNALPFAYLKVSVGKGMITWDGIIAIIDYINAGGILDP